MSVLLDTSYLYSSEFDTDQNFKRAFALRSKIKENEFGRIYLTDYIFDELITLCLARTLRSDSIKNIGDSILNSERIAILNIDKNVFNKSWTVFNTYKNFSFTDCTSIAIAESFGIKYIASFDAGFDKIRSIKRIF